MSDYTPTTERVRNHYAGVRVQGGSEYTTADDEFDRWLKRHDAEVAAKALREFRIGFGRRYGFQDPYGHFDSGTVSALHRQVEGMLDAEVDRIEREAGIR